MTPELGSACAHLAVSNGHVTCCDARTQAQKRMSTQKRRTTIRAKELLLRAHVNPHCRDRNGATLLARAALYGHLDLAKRLRSESAEGRSGGDTR